MSLNKQLLAQNKMTRDVRRLPPPPVDNAMFHPSRYKIELCRNYNENGGSCEYADRCLYAHGYHELRPCTFRHKLYKTQICKLFAYKGVCEYGARCSFIHAKPELERQLQHLERICGNQTVPSMRMPENPVSVRVASPEFDTSKILVRSISLVETELPSSLDLMAKYPRNDDNRHRLSTFASLSSKSSDDSD